MNISKFASKTGKMLADNSPVILTALGVTGTVAVAYLAGTASFKAAEVLREEQFKKNLHEVNKNEPLTPREKFELTWMLYLPAASTGVLTVTSIICANRIGARRAAALATAFNLSERAIAEYRNKVVEKIGANKEQAIRDEIAQDRVNRAEHPQTVIITGSPGEQMLCHDAFIDRYFMSDMETIRRAVNDINFQIHQDDSATVSDFYDLLGLPHTTVSDELGWNHHQKCEVSFSSILKDGVTPCLSFEFASWPIRESWRFS